MEVFTSHPTFLTYVLANLLAQLLFVICWKWPRMGRIGFLLVFGWAAVMNATNGIFRPQVYLDYAPLALLPVYREFITGYFADHITAIVLGIAGMQGFIALSMLAKGVVFKVGAVASIVFLIGIAPLGLASGFPCTLIIAAAMWLLLRHSELYFSWSSLLIQD